MVRFFKWCFFFVLAGSLLSGRSAEQVVGLEIAEKREFVVGDFSELKLSRKGLVDVRILAPNKIQLTGLREGFLILYVLSGDAAESIVSSFHITVAKAFASAPRVRELAILAETAGLRLRDGSISGVTSDFQSFFQLKKTCSADFDCIFYGQLSLLGQEKWRSYLSSLLGEQPSLMVSPAGLAHLSIACTGDEERELVLQKGLFDQLSHGLVSSKMLLLQCHYQQQIYSYYLAAKVVQVGETTMKEWGADAFSFLGGVLSSETLTGKANPSLRSLEVGNGIKIIGEPIVKLSAGRKVLLSSGGEFVTANSSAGPSLHDGVIIQAKELWKSYGLQLEFTLYPQKATSVLLSFKLSFKQPTNGMDSRLRSSTLESSVTLLLDQAEIVGKISLQSQEHRQRGLGIFQEIPLVGPIFKLSADEEAQSQLFLWLRISRDLGSGLPSGINSVEWRSLHP